MQFEQLDREDPLASFRNEFHIPKLNDREDQIYLLGNSLGLQPKMTQKILNDELEAWQQKGLNAYFTGDSPWVAYQDLVKKPMASIVGAQTQEVVVMNSLSVNLHFMMASFYRPTKERHKILIEEHAFPSDRYAVVSQIQLHGYNPENSLVCVCPREGEETVRTEDVLETIDREGYSIALVLLPGVQYYTGQVFDTETIAEAGHLRGCKVGFDLAHAAGSIPLSLHDWNVDFACWCNYKYLNSGPGSVASCFVHEKYATDKSVFRLAGWWGNEEKTRFDMAPQFDPTPSAEGWQVSNGPLLSLAATRASMEVFDKVGGMKKLRAKSEKLNEYFDLLLRTHVSDFIESITPSDMSQRGCQLSLRVIREDLDGKEVYDRITEEGVACDWRNPDVIRLAVAPLYNSFQDVHRFVEVLKSTIGEYIHRR